MLFVKIYGIVASFDGTWSSHEMHVAMNDETNDT